MKLGHVLIGVIVVLYVFVFYVNNVFPSPDIVLQDFELDTYFLITHEGSNPGAPAVLVEFIDYQCPFCLQMHGDIKKLLERYGDNINYVVRHLPSKERPFSLLRTVANREISSQKRFMRRKVLLDITV